MSTPPAAFRLSGVDVELGGHPVLQDLSLEIGAGEHVALVGPSGAGKTTLLRAFTGVIGPRKGNVEVGGVRLDQLKPEALRSLRSKIGFVHQDHSLVPNLRVSQNVVAGRLGQRGFWSALRSMMRTKQDDLQEVHQILERVGIGDKLFQRTDSLSGGQQQRVALARALYQQPTCLLADEPVASVDPARARSLIRLMVELAKEDGWTLVVSLHDLELAREFFPRVLGLRHGRVAYDGPPSELCEEQVKELYHLEETAFGESR
ncbi:MAG: ABC transporter ATP-binding protein [Planctomycetota bacterium]|nr:MAG: ABC transporter ATP-binding protein [Planctomycetota bacterium]